jgi:dipeptidyl aminopeptidase/acylaminoacyl peptidase
MARPRRRSPALAGRAVALALLTAGAALPGASARARPLQLEDLLQREAFGAVSLAPGDRWLVVEQRAPYADGARFDYGDFDEAFRTRILVADLATGGALRPLVPPQPGVGYQAGPISPDGARVVVYRITDSAWELGVATFATGEVRWLGETPEIVSGARPPLWVSATVLRLIACAPGVLPFEIRARHPQGGEPERWLAQAQGAASVTAVGSGRMIGLRPHAPPRRLLDIAVDTGAAAVLATGDFVDFEPSPSGDRVALIEAGDDLRLAAGRALQGPYGLAVRHMRLRILELGTGEIASPCPDCDIMASLLSWSPRGDRLLVFSRPPGAPWTAGDLLQVDAASGATKPISGGVTPAFVLRPESISAGWWGEEPLLFGRGPGGRRDDWFRLTGHGPIRLTGDLPHPAAHHLVVTPDALLEIADGAAWRIDPRGHGRRLADEVFAPLPAPVQAFPERARLAPETATALAGILGAGAKARVVRVEAGGRRIVAAPATGTVLALGARGAALLRSTGGGAEALVWAQTGAADHVLASLNRRLADVDLPRPVAIPHEGPNGERLTSWVFLPAAPQAGGAPPPLVIIPYPGQAHPTAPRLDHPALMDPTTPLLAHGYAVLIPSLPTWRSGGGPADVLADRLLAIVDAATRQQGLVGRFDPGRLGLWGHSFGGYGAVAMITQSDRFGAAIAAAPATDLISDWGQAGPQRRGNPDEGLTTPWSAGWMESSQGDMQGPPWTALHRYIRNSPLLHADRIRTPLLLAYGEVDGSHPGQAEELFSALVRQDKDAELLTYWGEQHLFASPGNLRDYYRRGLAFLDRYLRPAAPQAAAPPLAHPVSVSASRAPTTPRPPRASGPASPIAR